MYIRNQRKKLLKIYHPQNNMVIILKFQVDTTLFCNICCVVVGLNTMFLAKALFSKITMPINNTPTPLWHCSVFSLKTAIATRVLNIALVLAVVRVVIFFCIKVARVVIFPFTELACVVILHST